jgi:hypothetical protein
MCLRVLLGFSYSASAQSRDLDQVTHRRTAREKHKRVFFSFLFGEAKTTMLLMKSESEKKEGIFVEFFTVSIVLGVV